MERNAEGKPPITSASALTTSTSADSTCSAFPSTCSGVPSSASGLGVGCGAQDGLWEHDEESL